jgi:hypothetical protein
MRFGSLSRVSFAILALCDRCRGLLADRRRKPLLQPAALPRLISKVMVLRWLLPLAAVVLAVIMLGPRGATSVSGPVIGIDTDPAGNSDTAVGTIDACQAVTPGDTFQVDVTIQGVTDLAGFEAHLLYDPSVLKVTAVDHNFLLATAGSATNWGEAPTSQNPDTDGTLSVIVALMPLPAVGANGDGVLARITFEAVASGSCNLDLSGVKLGDSNVQPIGDTDADDDFDGPISKGQIAVNQPCPTSIPAVTPAATPAPAPTTTATPTSALIDVPPPTGVGTLSGLARAPPFWLSFSLALAGGAFLAAAVAVARHSS